LGALRTALWKFNLQLNEDKTGIAESKTLFNDRWKLEFGAIAISDLNSKRQEVDIHRFVDLTLQFCSDAKTGVPATWACRRLSRLTNFPENFEAILDALCRLARDFPSCTSHAAAFLINNQSRCRDPEISKRIVKWIKATMRRHLHHSHDFELAWCLLVAGVLRIPMDQADLPPFDSKPNSVVLALLGMLRERRLLSVPLWKWGWRAHLKQSGINGENWLPFYESVRRNWTTDKQIRHAVTSDPILAKMLAANVTFLEDQIFDVATINIWRRVFRISAARPTPQPASEDYEGKEAGPGDGTADEEFDDLDFIDNDYDA
jgi:hypothetical protein